ncbi:MAG: cytochrome c family protein [Magnetovibrio sp.]|nr:cytochrome c family protein [Magnetovibrio sp.]|tara:strand:+ start:3064 stop:3687 length:624 start_codon:yes stop_codon:yes gene_type:complete
MRHPIWKRLFFAILIALLVVLGSNIIGEILFSPQSLDKPVYVAEEFSYADKAKVDEGKPARVTDSSSPDDVVIKDGDKRFVNTELSPSTGKILGQLKSASPIRGAKLFRKCKSCHTTKKGGRNAVGPNLWGVVGRAKAGGVGFKYSRALREKEGKWTLSELDAFLADPKKFAKGTNMNFRGIKKNEDRADLLVYLHFLSDSPEPLPN